MQTVRDKLAAMEQKDAERELIISILRELPHGMPAPTVSNVRTSEKPLEPVAWLSWQSYDPDKTFDPVDVLLTLNDAGWQTLPATLVQWDDYRPGVEFGLMKDIPDTKGRYKLSDCWPVAPVWITPEQHTGCKAKCFLRSPSGRVFRVAITLPGLACHVWARRKEFRGGWSYERGTARITHPEHWHTLQTEQGESVARLHVKTGAQVDTEQGISAQVYWEPLTEQDDFPWSACDMLRRIMTA